MASKNAEKPSSDGSARAVRGASLLILLQVGSRAITFIANQLLLRFLTAQLLGVATQLEVYYLSVIFFARESLRVAIQRQDDLGGGDASKKNGGTNKSAQAVVNLGYLSTALGIPLALLFGRLYLGSLGESTLASTPYLVFSLYIYALAAVLELVSEPAFVVMQTRLQFGTRAAAEGVATFARCTVTLGTAVWGAHRGFEAGVLPFALGQLSYGIGLLLVYTWQGAGLARAEGFSLFPTRLTAAPPKKGESTAPKKPDFALSYFYRPTLQLASSMMAQSIVKHVLTQGDTFLVSILSTPTAQGVYALANNYGGLAARLLFQPIEESSRSYFSRLLAPAPSPSPPPHPLAATSLTSLLKLYTLLSLLITALGPTAAPLLLSLVAGPRWASSGAGATLAVYMWYLPLLAFNGVLEAFVASVATEAEVHRQSAWMGAFSLGFAGAGYVFLRVLDWGAEGLVVANGINMACRIVWCWVFIAGYFRARAVGFGIGEVLPRPVGLGAAAVAAAVVKRITLVPGGTPLGVRQVIGELFKVAAVALPLLGVLILSERQFLRDSYQALKGRRQKAT
ncbi:Rft protein-domain-containing protein [Lasiosphaeria hispida]|uniref:Man(5)GlcNAc(2)-PP-dolichol translocation protein RFT1 n=1 Tax=Lasiosphaeria hispida TaxID=260671 RepID=A0AAJ0HER4_9PEZI|nr:Rft protein-domain-containing protein [Lasiosphaeria hispida]